ncbi:ABC transporter permease [Actinocorallia longicatena]|uniref:ABC transporter permease n=1 Tax=Actinocorallia longicatena TaxID=111803 RepID=A0ABP6Q4Y0_9ACTN
MRSALIVLVSLVVFAALAPCWARWTGHPPQLAFPAFGLRPDGTPVPPGGRFWLGADGLGRDVLVRAAYAARTSLLTGFAATALATFLGVAAGLAGGFLGGAADAVVARGTEVLLAFPFLLAALAAAVVLGGGPLVVVPVVAVALAAPMARAVRARVLHVRELAYVEAARALGASPWRVMTGEVLPALAGPVVALAVLLLPAAVAAESTLAYLGAAQGTSWGAMLADGQEAYRTAWWTLLVPGGLLLAATLACAVLGDALTRRLP